MSHHQVSELQECAALHRATCASHDASAADTDHAPHPLHTLSRQLGNAQIARMLAQREGEEEDEEQVQARHDLSQREGMPEGESEEDQIQATPEVGLEGGPVSDALAGRINSRRGGGATLDAGTRAAMEQSFGASFEDVRVHTDAESDALNRSISAKAFTTGSDIFFRKDAGPSDHGLLAHELTHVVQQRSGVGSGDGGGMMVGPAGDSHEQQADSVASAITSGTAAQAQREAEEAQVARLVAQRDDALDDEEEPE